MATTVDRSATSDLHWPDNQVPWSSRSRVLCCASLPQSQENNSKNSVVSSSSTKDSSMSSSAPMVPHLYLVSVTLFFYSAPFHQLFSMFSSVAHVTFWWHCSDLFLGFFRVFFLFLCLVGSHTLHPLPLCFCFLTQTVTPEMVLTTC